MTLSVRAARPEDVPQILMFIHALADYEKLAHEVVATEAQLRESLFGSKPEVEALIGLLDQKPVGFALFFHNYSTFLSRKGIYLEDLFVLPERRGRGVGKALLAELARIAVSRNCGRMEWSVLDWNEPAIQFYQSLGTVQMSDWTTCRLMGESLKTLANQASRT